MDKLTSCISKEPLAKLDGKGTASILNYNLPQSTCYDATSYLGLDIPRRLFYQRERREPVKDYWDVMQAKSQNEILQMMARNEQVSNGVPAVQTEDLTIAQTVQNQAVTGLATQAQQQQQQQQSLRQATADNQNNPPNNPPVSAPSQVDANLLAQAVQDGFMPVVKKRFSGLPKVYYIPKPDGAKPQISILLHFKMCTYLGDYGAGRTVETFSLLPGERTTITIRTYQHNEEVKYLAQNVLDSFSESSAEDLQTNIDNETEHTTNLTQEETFSKTGDWKAGGNFGLNLGFLKIGGNGGGGGSKTNTTSVNEAIQTQVKTLVGSTTSHSAKSDSNREIEVNTSTTSTSISETEETIVRELENINKSRVLNFVFRQLLQEFISITYLYDVSFVYSNGFASQKRSCKLSGLDSMMENLFPSEQARQVAKDIIHNQLCNINDYLGTKHSLIEQVTQEYTNCINPKSNIGSQKYVRLKHLSQEYKGKTVNGIIMDVTHRIMRTPSVIVDALLGQGEALDCYNQRLQVAATQNAELENTKLSQAIKVIDGIERPDEQAKNYKKVFGECCDVAQCGCNGSSKVE